MRNNYCKLLVVFALIVMILNPIITRAAGGATPFNNIVFFGDSLSDNGNLYSVDFGFLPKSPPYFQGRFSNGYVWSEQLATILYNQSYVSTVNYAVGGETAIFHNPIDGFLPYSLTASLNSYLFRTIFSDRSRALFVIWIGANDYLPQKDPVEDQNDRNHTKRQQLVEALTHDVVANIKATVESLIYHGGTNFLIINLPDLSKNPYAKESGMGGLLNALTVAHNAKLATTIAEIQNGYKTVNIHLFDVNKLFLTMFADIDGFNKKHNTRLTNLETACWQGGYTLMRKQAQMDENEIAQKLEAHLKTQSTPYKKNMVGEEQGRLDTKAFAHYIATSPDLGEAYAVNVSAEQGALPCKNPDQYLYWDHIHPTTILHGLLSKEMGGYINQNYTAG